MRASSLRRLPPLLLQGSAAALIVALLLVGSAAADDPEPLPPPHLVYLNTAVYQLNGEPTLHLTVTWARVPGAESYGLAIWSDEVPSTPAIEHYRPVEPDLFFNTAFREVRDDGGRWYIPLEAGVEYKVRLRACAAEDPAIDPDACGPMSPAYSKVVDWPVGEVENVTARVKGKRLIVNWDAPTSGGPVARYRVYLVGDNGDGDPLSTLGKTRWPGPNKTKLIYRNIPETACAALVFAENRGRDRSLGVYAWFNTERCQELKAEYEAFSQVQ